MFCSSVFSLFLLRETIFCYLTPFIQLLFVIAKMIDFRQVIPPHEYRRHGHTCTCIHNGRLLCHAGNKASGQDDLTKNSYMFSPESKEFSEVDSPACMETRMHHAVAYVEREYPENDLLFLYGGYRRISLIGEFLDDLWMMDTEQYGKESQQESLDFIQAISWAGKPDVFTIFQVLFPALAALLLRQVSLEFLQQIPVQRLQQCHQKPVPLQIQRI